jgi:hypothetical protein
VIFSWWGAAPPPSDPGVLDTIAQDPDAVRDQACRIVSQSARVCAPPTTSAPPTSSGGFDLSFLGAVFWVMLILMLVLAVVLVVRSIGSAGPRRARPDSVDDDLDQLESGVVAIDRAREPSDWRGEAEAHRRAGRFRDALRCRYRALVGDLARRGLIDEIPGRTTGEERAQLRVVRPAAAPPFDEAADLFDGAWYGQAEVDASDDDRFQRLEHDVLGVLVERR